MLAVVADPNENTRNAAVSVLHDLNAEVRVVSDAENLNLSMAESKPDLLVVDAEMVTLVQVKQYRQRMPSLNVLLTYAASAAERFGGEFKSVLVVGATDFLPKPFDRSQLIHRIFVLDALKPSLHLEPVERPASLLDLHAPETGRIDAARTARFLGISLKALAGGLGRNYRTVHKTPDAEGLQPDLRVHRRIVELLLGLVGSGDAARAWLNTPSSDLSDRTPIELIKSGHAEAVRSLLESVAAGAPV